MVYKITKEKPFFLQYVPIFLNGIVKVDVVVLKVVNDNKNEPCFPEFAFSAKIYLSLFDFSSKSLDVATS